MTALPSHAISILEGSGVAILIGLLLAFPLSRFSGLAPEVRSQAAILLSFLIAVLQIARPVFSSFGSLDYFPFAVASAFGFAFAVARLRGERGRSPGGWLFALWHAILLVNYARSLLRA